MKKHRTFWSQVVVMGLSFQLLFAGGGFGLFFKTEVAAAADNVPENLATIERPYFPPSESERQSAVPKADALFSAYTEEQWINLAPKQSPRSDGNDPPDGSSSWIWSPDNPDQIATKNGLVLPSEQYPYKYKPIKVMSGKTVNVAYVDYNGKQVQVQSRIDYEKANFMSRNLPIIATAYSVTGDEKYARRVAVALDAWADAAPDFYMTGKNSSKLISADDVANYYNTDIQRASDHNGIAHEMHLGEIYSFDRIYNSQALNLLSQEKVYDVKTHIQNDFFLNITGWLIDYESMKVHTSTNLSGSVEAIAKVATVTETPRYMEWMDQYLDITVGDNFKRDGMFPESFTYHTNYASTNYEIAKQVDYYFQVHKAETDKLKDLEKKIKGHMAFLAKAKEVQKTVAFPDGDLPPFDDTNKGGASKRTATESQILPAFGHIMLGDGKGGQQTQFNLHFNDYGNHVHPNVLSTSLFGFGKELLGGIRYSRIATRNFSSSTLATNTVVVNKTNQYRSNKQVLGNEGHLFTQGIVSLYEPGLNGVEASEVYSKWAYPGTVDRYQRLNILNTTDPDHPYLIDLFKVTGGKTHEYILHGSTQFDETSEASFPLQKIEKPYPLLPDNVTWTDPVNEGDNRNWYGLFRDVSAGPSPGRGDVTFRDAGNSGLGTRIFMVDDGGNQVYLGKSPHSFRDKVYDDIYKFWRPSLIVKREDPNQAKLDSLFIDVIEPLNGESAIASVEKLPLKEASPEHLALSVKFKNGREDVVLVNMNQVNITGSTVADKPIATADGNYMLNGRIGIASNRGGIQTPYLIAGSSFRYGNDTLSIGTPFYSGTITGAVRQAEGADVDALITPEFLPEGDALKGKWVSLNFGSYKVVPDSSGKYPSNIKEQQGMSEMFQIDRVERRGGLTYIIMAEDHALSIKNGKTTELLRPQRTFENVPSFRIDLSLWKDKTPPVTSASVEGTLKNGWYTDTVTVKLQAADDRSGVASTFYKLSVTDATYSVTQSTYNPSDGWLPYTGPIAISQDGKYELRYYSTDQEGNAEKEQTIQFQRDATAPAIKAVAPVQGSRYQDSKDLAIQIGLDDALSGLDNSKTVITLDGNPVQQGTIIPLYTLPLGPHTLSVSATDLAGNTRSVTISFTIDTSIASLSELAVRFTANGWIDNHGISNSLQKKLEHGDLRSFVNEVLAQSGKHISAEAANSMLRDANQLLGGK